MTLESWVSDPRGAWASDPGECAADFGDWLRGDPGTGPAVAAAWVTHGTAGDGTGPEPRGTGAGGT